jgi:hypothetical protein
MHSSSDSMIQTAAHACGAADGGMGRTCPELPCVPDVLLMLIIARGEAAPDASCSAFAASLKRGDRARISLKGAAEPHRPAAHSKHSNRYMGLATNRGNSTSVVQHRVRLQCICNGKYWRQGAIELQ